MGLKTLALGAALSLLGLAVVVAAPYLTGELREYPGFLPWIRQGVEGQSWYTIGGLALLGFLAGFVIRKKPWLLGFSTIALLPLWATVEMTMDPTSHNLWPLEFMIYLFWGACAALGAKGAIFLRKNR